MATKLFVHLLVQDLGRSKAFFTELGLDLFGQSDDMASVIISEHIQVMLLAEPTFASYARKGVADATASTEVILVLGVETHEQVDELACGSRWPSVCPSPAGLTYASEDGPRR